MHLGEIIEPVSISLSPRIKIEPLPPGEKGFRLMFKNEPGEVILTQDEHDKLYLTIQDRGGLEIANELMIRGVQLYELDIQINFPLSITEFRTFQNIIQ